MCMYVYRPKMLKTYYIYIYNVLWVEYNIFILSLRMIEDLVILVHFRFFL